MYGVLEWVLHTQTRTKLWYSGTAACAAGYPFLGEASMEEWGITGEPLTRTEETGPSIDEILKHCSDCGGRGVQISKGNTRLE